MTGDVMCTWDGPLIPTTEWLFLGDNVMSPLEISNGSWDMEMLLCTVGKTCDVSQCGRLFTIKGYKYVY